MHHYFMCHWGKNASNYNLSEAPKCIQFLEMLKCKEKDILELMEWSRCYLPPLFRCRAQGSEMSTFLKVIKVAKKDLNAGPQNMPSLQWYSKHYGCLWPLGLKEGQWFKWRHPKSDTETFGAKKHFLWSSHHISWVAMDCRVNFSSF